MILFLIHDRPIKVVDIDVNGAPVSDFTGRFGLLRMMLKIIFLILSFSVLVNPLQGRARASLEAAEKVDCSGRLKFMLPGEFEIASVPYGTLRRGITTFTDSTGFAFRDKEAADYAKVCLLDQL
jgi:hypothetical protein